LKKNQLLLIIASIAGIALALSFLGAVSASARQPASSPAAGTRFVAKTGDDAANDCSNSANPCQSVQRAFAVAAPGDEIHVAGGVYTGQMRQWIPNLGEYVTATVLITKPVAALLGGFAPDFSSRDPLAFTTTLSAAGSPKDIVVWITGTNTTLDGFSITGADAENNGYGGGVRVNAEAPTVSHNRIFGNHAPFWGGGIYVTGYASPVLSDNLIYSNTAASGAGIYIRRGEALIENNLLQDNTASEDGGGIFTQLAAPTISGNILVGNHAEQGAGGLRVTAPSGDVLVKGNTIISNTAAESAGVQIDDIVDGVVTVEGNDIRGNTATALDNPASGLYADQITSTLRLVNNVIAGNYARGVKIVNFLNALVVNNTIVDNGLMGLEAFAWPDAPRHPFTATLQNNIIAGHTTCGLHGFNGVTMLVSYNDLWQNGVDLCEDIVDSNNLTDDPMFLAPAKGDYHLKPGSPAQDSGTPQNAPAFDKDGVSRPQGPQVDMGAYELVTFQLFLPQIGNKTGGTPPSPPPAGAPTLISPADGASLDSLTPEFQWQDASVPLTFTTRLEVALDPSFTQIRGSLYTGVSVSPDFFLFSRNFEPGTTYYWHVWHENDGQAGPFSLTWSFTTGSNGLILPAPALTNPADGSTVGTSVTLRWEPVAGADEYLVKYSPQGQGSTYYDWIVGTEEDVELDPGVYTWWVAAKNSYAIGEDSPTWQFTVPGQADTNPGQAWQNSIQVLPDGTEHAIR
jgi:hypothetical protein